MIIYNVTVSIDDDVHDDWLQWMKEVHIPEVMRTNLFVESKISKILADEEGSLAYSIMYLCNDMETLEKYQEHHAPALQKDHTDRYKGKFAAFRTLLEVKETF